MKIRPVIHESRLSPYHPDTLGRVIPPQPPVITETGEEYQVKEIVASRWTKHRPPRFQYQVQWLGYNGSHDTWELLENVTNAKEKRLEFHTKNPTAPSPTQRAEEWANVRTRLGLLNSNRASPILNPKSRDQPPIGEEPVLGYHDWSGRLTP